MLWTLDFFVIGYVLFVGAVAAIHAFIPNRVEAEAWMHSRSALIGLVDMVTHGLPILGLVLSTFGLLPGTRNELPAV